MGKSPGKWIKTVLFGKKSSKSNISKGREKLVNQKEASVASKPLETALTLDPSPHTLARNEGHLELENKEPENLLPLNQETDIVGSDHQDAQPDPEEIKCVEAATKVQAALRGYLARRAFRALKGIIRLQAVIRGHLVRRQAVATLCCMYGIIKLQAIVRGGRVRQSDVGFEMHKCNVTKPLNGKHVNPVDTTTKIANLSVNSFIRMLLASSTTIMALHIQYVSEDPNSVQSWLERWSASHFWKPVPQPRKLLDSKPQRKPGNISNGEAQTNKSKCSNRKIPTANSDLVSVQANPEFEKPKRNLRKAPSQPVDHPVQENPQNEFEKVKRNLRKVHNPIVENSVRSEVESETPKLHFEKVSEEGIKSSNEKIEKEATLSMSKVPDVEITPRISVSREASDMLSSYQVPINLEPLRENMSRDRNISGETPTNEPKDLPERCNDENSPITNGYLCLKEDSTGNKNQKPAQKSSFIPKLEPVEDGLQNSPSPSPMLPSYMAATESAKAKLRAQGSPRLGQDGGERSNLTRRHSLPSSTNGKISSHSPRMQKPVQAAGKGKRSDRTISSSKDGNGKLIQAEWRR